jgi:elongation factor Tu
MSVDAADEDSALTIIEVFRLAVRGTAVVGRIESGVLRTGEAVEILDGGKLIATARATVEMIISRGAGPGIISLLLGDLHGNLPRKGHTIRRPCAAFGTSQTSADQGTQGTGTSPS